jgi:hypothetical protein
VVQGSPRMVSIYHSWIQKGPKSYWSYMEGVRINLDQTGLFIESPEYIGRSIPGGWIIMGPRQHGAHPGRPHQGRKDSLCRTPYLGRFGGRSSTQNRNPLTLPPLPMPHGLGRRSLGMGSWSRGTGHPKGTQGTVPCSLNPSQPP